MKPILSMFLIVACTCVSAPAQEADSHYPAGLPGGATIILENESIQVVRIRILPHEKTMMHDVTPRVVVWLTDARFVDTFPDGTTREEVRKAGDVEWVAARRHAGENVGETPMEFFAVVPKSTHPATGGAGP